MKPLQEAIDFCDGQTQLAEKIREAVPDSKVSQAHVYNWLNRSDGVPPPEYCPAIEKITGVTRQRLRPDDWQTIWPELILVEDRLTSSTVVPAP